ncbi:MAG: RluA family pseudouridine synthase [Elusimicrobiota bacterium]|jgi:23S rRNA pseudouridine1911/1915/1917 synthase
MPLNQGCTYVERIDRRAEGRALVEHLGERYGHTGAPEWAARIAEGRVLVDGRPAGPGEILRRGQTVTWVRPPWEEPDAPLDYAVLHEDPHLLAVAKPSGLPTLPGAGFLENTLLARVRLTHPAAAPVHRLGRGTSGVVLFAKTPAAAHTLERLWREHHVVKVYRALAEGLPERDLFKVEVPIGPIPHPLLGTVHAASPKGKGARSHVRVLERREETTLVEVRIETGRPHQIRIHLAACGHPLAGDPLYAPGGGFRTDGAAVPGDAGYLLHALRLELPHPATGAPFIVEAPAPAVLRTKSES